MATILLAIALVGCASRTVDFTYRAQSTTCELHHRPMITMVVPLWTGTGLSRPTAEESAGERLFPHADAPVRTGYCIPVRETQARVYACADCVKARRRWLEAQQGSQRTPTLTRR